MIGIIHFNIFISWIACRVSIMQNQYLNMDSDKTPHTIHSLCQISTLYDTYIIDVYGVLFDGQSFVDSGMCVVKELLSVYNGSNVILLSNSSKTKEYLRQKLMKVDQHTGNLHHDVLMSVKIHTSGDFFVDYLLNHCKEYDNYSVMLCWGNENHNTISTINTILKTKKLTPLAVVKECKSANSIILLSCTDIRDVTAKNAILNVLSEAARYKIPCLCTNSDIIATYGDGQTMLCPGFYANEYKKLGQDVVFFGKPHKMSYDNVFRTLCVNNNVEEFKESHNILVIGDTMANDILGAVNSGLDSLFIGTEQEIWKYNMEDHPGTKQQIMPNYLMQRLKW